MKKLLSKAWLLATSALVAAPLPRARGRYVGRAVTHDAGEMAFLGRMPAGPQGFVSRTHPAWIEPAQLDATTPPTFYGEAVVCDAADNTVRKVAPGDDALTNIYGITVRPYPFQQSTGGMNADFGNAAIMTDQAVDILRQGYILGLINGDPVKGAPVYVWIAASAGDHVQGAFETAADGTNTIPINATFNGPSDENGIGEIVFNVGTLVS